MARALKQNKEDIYEAVHTLIEFLDILIEIIVSPVPEILIDDEL